MDSPSQTPRPDHLLVRLLASVRRHARELVTNAGGGEEFFAQALAIAETTITDPSATGAKLVHAATLVVEMMERGYKQEAATLAKEKLDLSTKKQNADL